MKTDIVIENKFSYDINYLSSPRRFGDLLLYQLGEIYCDNNAMIEGHVHDDFFELTYVVSGKGLIYAGSSGKEVKQNDLFISLPYERHEIISDKIDPLRYYYVALGFDPSSPFRKVLYNDTILSLTPAMRKFANAQLDRTFVDLITALESDAPFADEKFGMMVKIFCINIYQIYSKTNIKVYSSPVVDNEQNLYYKIMNYIDNNLTRIDHLTEIAAALNYNYVYLSRIFKRKFGKSIQTYYSEKKLELARRLIEENSMSIKKISEHLNYSSIYVFSRVFKKKYGMSPNNYRQKRLHEK